MQILLIVLVITIAGGLIYMLHPRFGASMKGARLASMQSKINYKDGAFTNLEHTPALVEGSSTIEIWRSFFFTKTERKRPVHPLPVVRDDLHQIPKDQNAFVWFGHSSYFIQLDGQRILVDPVFSKYATPVRIGIRAFDLEYNHTVDDLPDIDVMFITHDHWDHLDYNTFMKLKDRVKHIVTGLGVGAHLEKWGYPASQISELYWGESVRIAGLQMTAATSRHFSGRTFKRNVTLWSSFVLEGSRKIFVGGDSGYGKHFKEIGDQYGPFDYAFLENGQYNKLWPYIHMMPEEVPLAARDLQARYIVPVHSAKFPLANHSWDEPLNRVSEAAAAAAVSLVTPKIGQLVSLNHYTEFPQWWVGLE